MDNAAQQRDRLTFGPFRLDVRQERLWCWKKELALRPRSFAVLRYLVENPERVVTKEELLKTLWPGIYVSTTVLKVCIREIRHVLGDEATTPRFIETVRWRGYRWIAPLIPAPPLGRSQLSVARNRGLQTGKVKLATGFVGRDAELRQLQGWLEKARLGERQVVFVTGEAGIGKTALVDAFLAQVEVNGPVPSPKSRVHSLRGDRRKSANSLPSRSFTLSPPLIARGQCLEQGGSGEAYLPIFGALGQLCRGPARQPTKEVLQRYAPTWLVHMPALLEETELATLQNRTAGAPASACCARWLRR